MNFGENLGENKKSPVYRKFEGSRKALGKSDNFCESAAKSRRYNLSFSDNPYTFSETSPELWKFSSCTNSGCRFNSMQSWTSALLYHYRWHHDFRGNRNHVPFDADGCAVAAADGVVSGRREEDHSSLPPHHRLLRPSGSSEGGRTRHGVQDGGTQGRHDLEDLIQGWPWRVCG